MKKVLSKTTQVTKPKQKSKQKKYIPQTPDTNRPDLGKPTPKIITSGKKKSRK